MKVRIQSALVCGLTLLLAACSDSTKPKNPLGRAGTTYQLLTYNGLGLPALIAPSAGNCGGSAVGGQLYSVAESEAAVSISTSSNCSAGSPITTTTTQGMRSTAANGSLVLTFSQQGYADTISLNGATATVRDRGNTYVFTGIVAAH